MADGLTNPHSGPFDSSGVSEWDNAPQVPQLHPVWNFETVENELFRLPKKVLAVPGSAFANMFTLPSTSDAGVDSDGQTLENPVVLPHTKASDFSALLTLLCPWINMYNGSMGMSAVSGAYIQGVQIQNTTWFGLEDWFGILRLANKWNYDEIRQTAIDALNKLVPRGVKRIRAGREYLVQAWVKEGYHDIVSTRGLEPSKLAEAPYHFDQATIAGIFYIQVASLVHLGGTYCHASSYSCRAMSGECGAIKQSLKDAHSLIDKLFEDDIQGAYYGSAE